jgi:minor histocompatibility antigen H13
MVILTMAVLPIYVGSLRSVKTDTKYKKEDVMTKKDAAMFPVIASCTLFGLFLLFKFVGKEYINLIMGAYFSLMGVLSLTTTLRSLLLLALPAKLSASPFRLRFARDSASIPAVAADGPAAANTDAVSGDAKAAGTMLTRSGAPGADISTSTTTATAAAASEALINFAFDYVDMISLALAACVGVAYMLTKHWILNNLFGIAFAITGVELIAIGSFQIGCIMMLGLFFYDIFWVFGTDVMVTVARSFDAPIKVVFPKDFLEHGIFATQNTMLGLGDIVIPGILISLLVRFDHKRSGGKSRVYFHSTLFAYVVGMVTTFAVMHLFNAAQPALLYLVPACVCTPSLVALARGEVKQLLSYADEHDDTAAEEAAKAKAD